MNNQDRERVRLIGHGYSQRKRHEEILEQIETDTMRRG